MKNRNLYLAGLLLAGASLFAACGDDPPAQDPDGDSTDTDEEVDVPPNKCLTPAGGGFANVVDGEARADGLCVSFADSTSYTAPTTGVTCDSAGTDCDSDGVSDVQELFYNESEVGGYEVNGWGIETSFFNANTDGTGGNDGEELAAGTDPTDPNDPFDDENSDPGYTGGDVFSYVSAINFTEGTCCFDLNDGPGIDNAVAGLLGTIAPLLSQLGVGDLDLSTAGLSELITDLVKDGTITLIAEHLDFPTTDDPTTTLTSGQTGNLGVKLYLGEIEGEADMDDAAIIADYTARADGDGTFIISDALQGEGGGDLVLSGVIAENGAGNDQIRIKNQDLPITIDIAGIVGDEEPAEDDILAVILDILGDEFTLTIQNANILGEIEEQTSSDAPAGNVGIASTAVVGLDVGGAIGLQALLDILNPALAECFDEVGSDDAIFTLDQDNGQDTDAGPSQRGTLVCEYASTVNDLTVNNDGLGGLCEDVGGFAGIVCGPTLDTILGAQLDVDTDGDGVYDGISVGIRLVFAGAADTTVDAGPTAQPAAAE